MTKPNKNRLGRGLDALLAMDEVKTSGSSSINEVELSKIEPNPDQPRTIFEEETLSELAESIRAYGIVQPITLKEVSPDKYMIIAGERRYRAALKVGLTQVPAYVKTIKDDDVAVVALIENIQRTDLNAVETALAFQNIIETKGLTQEQLSEQVGKKRATVANYLRLLKLPAEIQIGLKNKHIDMGHARALISIGDPEVQLAIYEQIITQGLSVRNVEELARNAAEGDFSKPTSKKPRKKLLPDEYKVLKDHLSSFFETKVKLAYDDENGKGRITIPFTSEEELEKIIGLLDGVK